MTDNSDSIEQSVDSVSSVWLENARKGDEGAWKRLVDSHRALVCWWCSNGGIPLQEIDDIAQEVFVGLAKALPTFERKSFRGFLRTLTRNKICDYWRKDPNRTQATGGSTAHQVLGNVPADVDPDSDADVRKNEVKLIFDAIVRFVEQEFAPQQWRAFWETAVNKRKASDVAEDIGVTVNQVYLAKSRVLRRIREEFGDFQIDVD